MLKEKVYRETRFDAETIEQALDAVEKMRTESGGKIEYSFMSVEFDDESSLRYDSIHEFFSDYRATTGWARLEVSGGGYSLDLRRKWEDSSIAVKADTRAKIESVFSIFEKRAPMCRIEKKPVKAISTPVVVFVGHGRSAAWRDIKDHLQDKHGYKVEAYETGARAGHTIRDILEDMLTASSFAILVMTGEDEQADGKVRARQNVIHEAGLFQGRLGFPRAIILLENGVEEFSNVQGVQYIPFSKGNIKECFGEVLATLRREFPRS